MTIESDPVKPPVQPTVLAIFLAALSMLGPFSIDTIFPAFPPIGREFAADPVAMQQTVSVYLISYAVMSLFLGPWSDACHRARRRRFPASGGRMAGHLPVPGPFRRLARPGERLVVAGISSDLATAPF